MLPEWAEEAQSGGEIPTPPEPAGGSSGGLPKPAGLPRPRDGHDMVHMTQPGLTAGRAAQ